MKPEPLTSEQKHAIIVEAAEDKKANYITSLDLSGKTTIADYFVICSGTSNIHIRAIAEGIMEAMEKHGHRRELLEGWSEASWVLLSFGDVIAHIMAESQRDYFKLEKLWGAAPTGATVDEVSNEIHVDKFEEDADDELDEDFEHEPDEFEESEIVADEAPGGEHDHHHNVDRE